MAQLVFYDDKHIYELDGQPVPSVSELQRPLGGDPVEEGEEDVAFAIAQEAAAERGVILHAALESLLRGANPDDIEIPASYDGHFASACKFVNDHEIIPYMMETPLFNESMRYAGTPDLICSFDGTDTIIDYKFVSSINKTRVKSQLNAYRLICLDKGIAIHALYAVQFMGDGRYRLYPVAIDECEFAMCYGIYHAKHKTHPRGAIA